MENVVNLFPARAPLRERVVLAVAEARSASGLTLAAFAAAINAERGYGRVTADVVSAWERGVAVAPADAFLAMIRIAGSAGWRILETTL
jgi:DNA-binding transcriptional regulator YiaG